MIGSNNYNAIVIVLFDYYCYYYYYYSTDHCDNNIYTFLFNISTIMKTELVFKSDLRVYLELGDDIQGHVEVSLLFLNKTKINTRRLNASSQWLEFTVSPAVEYWLRNGVQHLQGFKILMEQNSTTQVCSRSVKLRTEKSGEYLPLLTVYSYETEESKRSFIQIVEKVMTQAAKLTSSSGTEEGVRVSRDASPCGTKTLTLSRLWLNEHIFAPDGKTMFGPASIDINLCEGVCEGVPIHITHSTLLYLLAMNSNSEQGSPVAFDTMAQFCVPAEYKAIQVVLKIGTAFVIESLLKVSVKQCACMYAQASGSCKETKS